MQLGQHQFTVSSIIDSSTSESISGEEIKDEELKQQSYHEVAAMLMTNAEDLLTCVTSQLQTHESAGELAALEKR